jgi:hypothetical protein
MITAPGGNLISAPAALGSATMTSTMLKMDLTRSINNFVERLLRYIYKLLFSPSIIPKIVSGFGIHMS